MPVPRSRPISIRSMTDSTHSSHPRHHFFAMVRIVTGAPVASRAEYRIHTKAGLDAADPDRAPPSRQGREVAKSSLGRNPSDPLHESLVQVISLVGQPDTRAQSQAAGVLTRDDCADDRHTLPLGDVRQQHFEQVATERYVRTIVIERVDLCEHGTLKVGSNRRTLEVGRRHDLSAVQYELPTRVSRPRPVRGRRARGR
jgi:hypothetical protein